MPSTYTRNLDSLAQQIEGMQRVRSSEAFTAHFRDAFHAAVTLDVNEAIDDIEQGHLIEANSGSANIFHAVHYTSVATLISILKAAHHDPSEDIVDRQGYLRMYSSIGFNDPGEGVYLARVGQETADLHPPPYFNEMVWRSPSEPEAAEQYAYVASFIRPNPSGGAGHAADNLVFWRGYGQEGTGCALKLTLNPSHLREVKYGSEPARETVDKLHNSLGPILELVSNLYGLAPGLDLASAVRDVVHSGMERLNYLYKSAAYEYEQECRVVATPLTIADTGIRPNFEYTGMPGSQSTKRFIEYPALDTDPATGIFRSTSTITLGPCVTNRSDTRDYLEQLRLAAGLHGITVRLSNIEYRNASNR